MAVPDRLSTWSAAEVWDARTATADPASSSIPGQRTSRRTESASVREARAEARRRMRLIRRRRLDLLQDAGLALFLAILVLVFTAGLGVVALLAVPAALVLVGSLVVERRRRGPRRSA